MAKERIAIWDNLKGILIFLVVLGHFADLYTGQSKDLRSLFLFIYSFHMPLFIFISGLFSKRAVREKDWKKVFEYIVIYLFAKIVFFLSQWICLGVMPEFFLFKESMIPWYALALAVYYMITIILQDVDERYLLAFSIILACFAGYDSTVSTFMAVSRCIVYYPFFLLGYYIKPEKILYKLEGKKMHLVAFLMFAVYLIFIFAMGDSIYWIRPLLTGQNPFSTLGLFYPYGGFVRLIYYVIVVILSCLLILLTPKKKCFLSLIGSRSLYVYLLHYTFLLIITYSLNLDDVIMKMLPEFGYKWVVVAAMFVTLICSMKWCEKMLEPILKIKWRVNADE